jgi:hypothetical protein
MALVSITSWVYYDGWHVGSTEERFIELGV